MQLKSLLILVACLLLGGCSYWKDNAFKNDFGGMPITQGAGQTYVVEGVTSENFQLLPGGNDYKISESAFKEGLEKALKSSGLSPADSAVAHYKIDAAINSIVPNANPPWDELTIKLVADYHVYSANDNIAVLNRHIETSNTSPALAGGSVWGGLLLTSPMDVSTRARSTSAKAAHDNIVEFVKSLQQPNTEQPKN
jgi:hypothetical protein